MNPAPMTSEASHATIDSEAVAPYAIGGSTNPLKHGNGVPNGAFPPTTIFLRPIAHPSALGLAAWASSAFVVSAYLAEWYGSEATAAMIWPFVLTFGGFGQLAAGMWSFNARDTLDSVLHTMWGAFWFALALYYAFVGAGASAAPADGVRFGHLQNFAIWLVPLAAITGICTVAALRRDLVYTSILGLITLGSVLSIIGWFATSETVVKISAYVWLLSSLVALYRVLAYFMHEATRKDESVPIFRQFRPRSMRRRDDPEWGAGGAGWDSPYREPGVVQGEY